MDKLTYDEIDAASQRVLDGTASPQDVEAVALWAKNTAGWLRRLRDSQTQREVAGG